MVDCNIDIGDKVYVGGIYGKDFEIVNNKIGTISNIVFASYQDYSTYLVDVVINGEIFPLNLSYVYKLNDLDTYDYEGILEDYPLEYYFNKFEITGEALIRHDEEGSCKVISKTKNGIAKVFYLTSIN